MTPQGNAKLSKRYDDSGHLILNLLGLLPVHFKIHVRKKTYKPGFDSPVLVTATFLLRVRNECLIPLTSEDT